MILHKSSGICPICEAKTEFISESEWLRDYFKCSNCGSIPRERALMYVLRKYYPDWKNLTIHETSPAQRGASIALAEQCVDYIPSQYYPDKDIGTVLNGLRCENLEKLSFSDQSIDIHISQDVMEHVLDPSAAFKEIARTLKPGGAHIFTVPLVNKNKHSLIRARLLTDGKVEYLCEPSYHRNPIDRKGSLVTYDWGFDITKFIFDSCGLFTDMIIIDDLSMGIRAEYIEVLVTKK